MVEQIPSYRIVRENPQRDIPTRILRVCWITYMDPISGTPVCWPIFSPPSSSHQRSQVPFRGGNPRPVMFRSPSAHSAPLGYLSRQLGLAAIPLKPSAWVAWVKFCRKVMATRNSRARKPVEVGRNYPIIYGVSYMSGGADLFHQQYFSCSI